MGAIGPYVDVLLPSVGIFLILLFVYRAVIRSDKSERDAYSSAVREYREKHGVPEGEGPSPSGAESPAPSASPRREGAAAGPGAHGNGQAAAEGPEDESEDRRL